MMKIKLIDIYSNAYGTINSRQKGEEFVPYNKNGIKGGLVDAKDGKNHISLVFNLKPGTFYDEGFREKQT
ncbi:hypothetical protein JOD43_000032 [Pullulanibacillus pueri]|nr:hypothetical protein [Pullulanibacillus pueri]MBM7679873.1 hypothetical protein [Pullulanibacillus pueri]